MKAYKGTDRRTRIRVDLTGQRFNRLQILWAAGRTCIGKSRVTRIMWAAQCDCGQIAVGQTGQFLSGLMQSCGCRRRKGSYFHPIEYKAYQQAEQRCTNPNWPQFHHYGGRGIEFRFQSFEAFFADIGSKPSPELELDRIDNNGHYEAGNVRWTTRSVQLANRRPFHRKPKLAS